MRTYQSNMMLSQATMEDNATAILQQAAKAKMEWVQLSQYVTSHPAKYPTLADWAWNHYEYYMSKASKAGTLEAKYSHMATPDGPVNAQ